jgi:hypothetical protein
MQRGERLFLVIVRGAIVLWAWVVGRHTPVHLIPLDPSPFSTVDLMNEAFDGDARNLDGSWALPF